ncbi:MAG: Cof-type HAD-IIB family hydrolase [Bacteroidales bacterium]|nr:Cof-type HAD-IIB family hydrolase [Bacteroidales bacterium]
MCNKRIESVFFDIDGTLVSFKTHQVPESTKRAIRELRAKGVKVFVATGRMLAMLGVLDDIEFDGYITYNGGCCVDGSRKEIFSHPIPVEQLKALEEYLKEEHFPVSYMRKDGMYVNELAPIVKSVAEHVNVEPPVVMRPEEIVEEPVYQLCIYLEDDAKLNIVLNDVLTDCISNRWISWFADVNVRGVTKQLGIDKILEHFGLPLETSMAFGDAGNDIPMIKHAAIGVAMGNASEQAKEAADYVTDTVDDDGVYKALLHFGVL